MLLENRTKLTRIDKHFPPFPAISNHIFHLMFCASHVRPIIGSMKYASQSRHSL